MRSVRWKHRIEHAHDLPGLEDERDAPVERGPVELERRQAERRREAKLRIGDHRVRQAKPFRHLDLVLERLRREARDAGPEPGEIGRVVTKRAGLRRAAARAGTASQPSGTGTPGFPVLG